MKRKDILAKFKLISLKHSHVDDNGANHFKVILGCGRKRFTTPYSQGSAIKDVPNLERLVHCVAMDATSYINARDEDDFCEEFGYTDSVKQFKEGLKAYKGCKRAAEFFERADIEQDDVFILANEDEEEEE